MTVKTIGLNSQYKYDLEKPIEIPDELFKKINISNEAIGIYCLSKEVECLQKELKEIKEKLKNKEESQCQENPGDTSSV